MRGGRAVEKSTRRCEQPALISTCLIRKVADPIPQVLATPSDHGTLKRLGISRPMGAALAVLALAIFGVTQGCIYLDADRYPSEQGTWRSPVRPPS